MLVSELIELLQRYPQNLPVKVLHRKHDYWGNYGIDMPGVDTANLELAAGRAPWDWQVREQTEDTTECVVIF